MKKYIFLAVSLCTILSGMEVPKKQPLCTFNESFDMWEFFIESNKLDSLTGPIPCWNKDSYKNDCSIDTVAYLHILQNSNLATKNLKILDATCKKGHTSAFLAREAKRVCGYDDDENNLHYAQQKNSARNLGFVKKESLRCRTHCNYYDLIVAFNPSADAYTDNLKKLRTLLVPHGEIFCTFTTRSNPLSIAAAAYGELFQKIQRATDYFHRSRFKNFIDWENEKYPTDEILKNMINEAQFNIISYEQKSFDILILDKNEFKKLHTANILNSPSMQHIDNPKKREKLATQFVERIVSKIKKDDFDCWFYPINTTVVHIRKTD